MPRYLVLSGRHEEGNGPDRRVWRAGDVVDTKDLVNSDTRLEKFNHPGREKFRRLRDDEQSPSEHFDAMTKAQLIEYAAEEEIDISECKTKAEILEVVKATYLNR